MKISALMNRVREDVCCWGVKQSRVVRADLPGKVRSEHDLKEAREVAKQILEEGT